MPNNNGKNSIDYLLAKLTEVQKEVNFSQSLFESSVRRPSITEVSINLSKEREQKLSHLILRLDPCNKNALLSCSKLFYMTKLNVLQRAFQEYIKHSLLYNKLPDVISQLVLEYGNFSYPSKKPFLNNNLKTVDFALNQLKKELKKVSAKNHGLFGSYTTGIIKKIEDALELKLDPEGVKILKANHQKKSVCSIS